MCITLQGKGVSGGIAIGNVSFFENSAFSAERKTITGDDGSCDGSTCDAAINAEIERFKLARLTAGDQLDALAQSTMEKIGKENALLFEVHRMMLEDTDYCDSITDMITKEHVCAEFAVLETGKIFSALFSEMDDEYMKARAADVIDISGRVITILRGKQTDISSTAALDATPAILAADDFSPSETAQFDRAKVLALITRLGSANSHTAIFARTMGIPAIIGLSDSLTADMNGKHVIVDGDAGIVHVSPDKALIAEYEAKIARLIAEKATLEKFRGKPTTAKDGRSIKLCANIGSVNDVKAVLENDAEGIGLFRSEFLYLESADYPTEDAQYSAYKKVAELMQGKQVVIRTLDIGADKQADYFNLPHEENPALGLRAIRICLTRPQIFKTQLRALYRASAHGNIAIMFPMINSIMDVRRAKAIAEEVRTELASQKIAFNTDVPIGIMIETPASAIISDVFAKEVDFFSVGTNDLTQYTLAVDRQNESMSEFCDTHHEAILRLLRLTVENAHKAGIWAGICGSLGADPALTKTFMDMGFDELSVTPSDILPLRSRIAEM